MLSLQEKIERMWEIENEKSQEHHQPNLKLVEKKSNEIKTKSIYQMFYELSQEVEKVNLEGKKYPCADLVVMLRDFPITLSWERGRGWRIEPLEEFKEEYIEFRNNYLSPNTAQIKQLIKLANEMTNKQVQKLEGGKMN